MASAQAMETEQRYRTHMKPENMQARQKDIAVHQGTNGDELLRAVLNASGQNYDQDLLLAQ